MEGVDPRTKTPVTRAPDPKAPLSALVFKTITDPHVGKLSLFRVYSGTFRSDSQVLNATRDAKERIGHLGWLMGKTQKPVEALGPGEIGVVAKLKDTLTGDTLSDEANPVILPGISFPEPAISFAIQPKTRGDEDKISTALHRMAEEDPTLHHHFDPETKQLLVSGIGQLHVEVVVERMKRKYNVDVSLLPPRIPYKETVKGRAEVQGKYKKQTGGRGQYGDTWLKIEPLARGGGFEFVDDIFGGAIPRNFIPSVEKGVRDCMKRGILAGYPVVDLRVTLYDGSYHDVDSSDMAFQIAASMGLQKGFMEARPCLLEPIMNVEISAPSDHAGDVIGDVNGRRGRIVGMEPEGEVVSVRAQVPMAEMLTYESSLRSMTGGRGGYSMEFSHYEEVPGPARRQGGERGQGREGEGALARPSFVTHIECTVCGHRHEAGRLLTVCERCGQMLAVRYDLPRVAAAVTRDALRQRAPGHVPLPRARCRSIPARSPSSSARAARRS